MIRGVAPTETLHFISKDMCVPENGAQYISPKGIFQRKHDEYRNHTKNTLSPPLLHRILYCSIFSGGLSFTIGRATMNSSTPPQEPSPIVSVVVPPPHSTPAWVPAVIVGEGGIVVMNQVSYLGGPHLVLCFGSFWVMGIWPTEMTTAIRDD